MFLGATSQVVGPADALWQFLSFFSVVGPLPVLWIALRDDFKGAAQACGIAVGFVGFAKFLLDVPYSLAVFIPQIAMILVIARYALLSRKTDQGVEEWFPVGTILAYLTGIAVVAIAAMIALDIGTGIPDDALRQLAKQFATSSTLEDQMFESMKMIVYFYPAILSVASMVVVLANAGFVQKVMEQRKLNIRPTGAFSGISLPSYYLWFVAGALALTVLGSGQLGPNLLLPLMFGFFLVGLSLVHELNSLYKLGTISLVVFYVVMILFGGIAILVCLAGIIEPWLRSHLQVLKIE